MTVKATQHRFSEQLKCTPQDPNFNAQSIEYIPVLTIPAPQCSLQEQQLITASLHYQQDPVNYVDDYLKTLKNYIRFLQQTNNNEQLVFYFKQLLATYESLNEQQLTQYAVDYADALMDYALFEANSRQDLNKRQQDVLSKEELANSQLEITNNGYLTALGSHINKLEKTENLKQALTVSQEMLQISKMAMQQTNNIEQRQQYLYCLSNYLLLVSQLPKPLDNPQSIAAYYKEALTLYQQLYEQSNNSERLYADILIRYNQFLVAQQNLAELISCNQHIIELCLERYNKDSTSFTGYLYMTCLKQLANYMEASCNLPLTQQLFKQASDIFQALLARDPTDEIKQANCAYVFYQLAYCLVKNGYRQEAINYSQQSLELHIELLSLYPQYELASEQALIQYQMLTGHQ